LSTVSQQLAMKVIKGLDNPALKPIRRVVADGGFDGMHLGHRAIFDTAREIATQQGAALTALTFEPTPVEVFSPHDRHNIRLTLAEERGLEQLGVETLIIARFSKHFQQISAEQYARDYLVGRLGTIAAVISESHSWGRRAEADASRIRQLGGKYGFDVRVVPLVTLDGEVVSSSAIRNFLWQGKVQPASRLLGRPYPLYGVAQPGSGRGEKLGFPTINLQVPPAKLVPGTGVYAAVVEAEGLPAPPVATYRSGWPAAISVGASPTYDPEGDTRLVEVHLLDINVDNACGTGGMMVHFLRRLRDLRTFTNEEELKAQIQSDIDQLRREFNLPNTMPLSKP